MSTVDDLICNDNGNNKIMLSHIPKSSESDCDFYSIPAQGGTKPDGSISIAQGAWCMSGQTIRVGDINADGLSDVVCNIQGINKIMLCDTEDKIKGPYQFKSIDVRDPDGKFGGQICMATHKKWCPTQNIFIGDYDGNTAYDILCNQDGAVTDNNGDPECKSLLSDATLDFMFI